MSYATRSKTRSSIKISSSGVEDYVPSLGENKNLSSFRNKKIGKFNDSFYKEPIFSNSNVSNHDHCDACSLEGNLLCCDGCPCSFHCECLDPPITELELDDGDWFCNECLVQKGAVKGPNLATSKLMAPLFERIQSFNPRRFQLPSFFGHKSNLGKRVAEDNRSQNSSFLSFPQDENSKTRREELNNIVAEMQKLFVKTISECSTTLGPSPQNKISAAILGREILNKLGDNFTQFLAWQKLMQFVEFPLTLVRL